MRLRAVCFAIFISFEQTLQCIPDVALRGAERGVSDSDGVELLLPTVESELTLMPCASVKGETEAN